MIDSIRVRIPYMVGYDTTKWPHNGHDGSFGQYSKYTERIDDGDVFVSAFTIGKDKSLYIHANLPRLLVGHNSIVLTMVEIRQAVIRLESAAIKLIGIGVLPPISSWELSWVDFVFDWVVSSPSLYLADFLTSLNYRKTAKPTKYFDKKAKCQTLAMKGGGRSYKIYNKEEEVQNQLRLDTIVWSRCPVSASELSAATKGKLRFEVRLDRDNLKRQMVSQPCTVGGLVTYLVSFPRFILCEEWDSLSSGNSSPSPLQALSAICASSFSEARKLALFGFFATSLMVPMSDLRTNLKVSDDTLRRNRDDLTSIGVPLGRTAGLKRLDIPDPVIYGKLKLTKADMEATCFA